MRDELYNEKERLFLKRDERCEERTRVDSLLSEAFEEKDSAHTDLDRTLFFDASEKRAVRDAFRRIGELKRKKHRLNTEIAEINSDIGEVFEQINQEKKDIKLKSAARIPKVIKEVQEPEGDKEVVDDFSQAFWDHLGFTYLKHPKNDTDMYKYILDGFSDVAKMKKEAEENKEIEIEGYFCCTEYYPEISMFALDSDVFKPSVRRFKIGDLAVTGMVRMYDSLFSLHQYRGFVNTADKKQRPPFFVEESKAEKLMLYIAFRHDFDNVLRV